MPVYRSHEDGGSMFFRNVGIYLQLHTVLQPIKSDGDIILIRPKFITNNNDAFLTPSLLSREMDYRG
jgi:hypothetical protein